MWVFQRYQNNHHIRRTFSILASMGMRWACLLCLMIVAGTAVSCTSSPEPAPVAAQTWNGERPLPKPPTPHVIPKANTQNHATEMLPTPTLASTVLPQPLTTETAVPTPTILCSERLPNSDTLTTITKQYPISGTYTPNDLVGLSTILPPGVVWGEQYLRQDAANALATMIGQMVAEGLRPQILSAYRSYNEQAAAYGKWLAEQPARADIISARPGSSEHQLGTTVDFGSPELSYLVGPTIQFHALFANTSEGVWLQDHAHEYGFTLSYPENGFDVTGFVYEPWHYRYVGTQTATMLHDNGQFLTQWQFEHLPIPCIPDE